MRGNILCGHSLQIYALLITTTISAGAARIEHQQAPRKITFPVLAIADRIPVSSFSLNRDSLLVVLVDQQQWSQLAKIAFSYMGYEYPFSADLLDYSWLDTFVAVRDRSCDESWYSFSTKSQKGADGSLVTSNVLELHSSWCLA